jgi:hypothetical protein
MFAMDQRLGDGNRHLLLLGPKLEVWGSREEACGGEDVPDLFHQIVASTHALNESDQRSMPSPLRQVIRIGMMT